jgi:hypothetical protein
MSDKTSEIFDNRSHSNLEQAYHDNGDGTYSEKIFLVNPPAGGGAATVADGADVNAGTTTDAAITTDANGTLSAKLRGLVVLFVSLLTRIPATLGQKAKAASFSVTVASDQDVLATSANQATEIASLALLEPAASCAIIAPDDGNDLASSTRGLMVSVAGDVKVNFVTTGTAIVLTGLLVGVVYPFRVKRVYATGTTATGILALY